MIARTPSGAVSTEARRKAQKKGHTMKGGSFPINDLGDLANAKHDVGRAHNPEAARRWIDKRAKELGGTPLGGGKKRGGMVEGHAKKPHLGRAGRARRADGGNLGKMPSEEDFGEGTVNPDWSRLPRPRAVDDWAMSDMMNDEQKRNIALGGAKALLDMGYASKKNADKRRGGRA